MTKIEAERAALKAAWQTLQLVNLSPFDLCAYAVVTDAAEDRRELMAQDEPDMFPDGSPTMPDVLAEQCDAELEDPRDGVIDLYQRAEEMWRKHYDVNGVPL